jgi:hypothetical protein
VPNAAPPTVTPGGVVPFCTGTTVQLTSSASTGNQWYFNGAPITNATAQTFVAINTGLYAVAVIQGGCTSSLSNNVTLNALPLPATPVITVVGNVFTSSATTGNQWFRDGQAITGATGQNYTATMNGSYTVSVTVNNCTSAPSQAVQFTTTAVGTIGNAAFTVSPNPVQTNLLLKYSSDTRQFVVWVHDMQGRMVIPKRRFSGQLVLNFSGLAAGLYKVMIEDQRTKELYMFAISKF